MKNIHEIRVYQDSNHNDKGCEIVSINPAGKEVVRKFGDTTSIGEPEIEEANTPVIIIKDP